MGTFARRVEIEREKREGGAFHLLQLEREESRRGRARRKLNASLRRMEPVLLQTPRWSEPQPFLEGVAMELAVSQPSISCRTLPLDGLRGQAPHLSWRRILMGLAQLSADRWAEASVPYVASNTGFQAAAVELLLRAQERNDATAIFLHGVDGLSLEVIEALSGAWNLFSEEVDEERMVTMLLASELEFGADDSLLEGARGIQLSDFSRGEGGLFVVGEGGNDYERELAWEFAGGVPALLGAMARGSRRLGGVPRSSSGMLRALGDVGREVQGVVSSLGADPQLADRIEELAWDGPSEEREIDVPLVRAGLVARDVGPRRVESRLRASAFASMLEG